MSAQDGDALTPLSDRPSGRLILITGGAGFIGKALAQRLVANGERVRGLDILNPQVHRHPETAARDFPGELIVGDVRDESAVAAAMDGVSSVVHLAAETGVGQSMYQRDRYTSVNVDGTRNVVHAAGHAGGVPVLVASSRAVYGAGAYDCARHGREFGPDVCQDARPSPSREDDPLLPLSVYGETKMQAEAACRSSVERGTPVAIIRPQNVIGAGQAPHNPYTGVLAAFSARLRQGLAPQVYGAGTQTRDFIAVNDVVSSVEWLLCHVDQWSSYPVLNVGTGQRVTLKELALTACAASGAPPRIEHVPVTRPGDIDDACADLGRYLAAGLPQPTADVFAGVKDFLDYAAAQEPVSPEIWDRALTELDSTDQGAN